jgi:DNA-binding phage protein
MNDQKRVDVAREACMSRRHLFNVRGRSEPTIFVAMHILDACGRLLFRRVYLGEVFDTK